MNRDELAKSLGMSKATLYKRAKELEIPKNSLDSLTDEEKNKLMNTKLNYSRKNINNNKVFSEIESTTTYSSNEYTSPTFETLKQLNIDLNEQLKIKDKQLTDAQDNITRANKLTEEAHKIADQAQQLQLDLQQKLNQSEQEKLELMNKNKQLSANFNSSDSSKLENDLDVLNEQLKQEETVKNSLQVENDELKEQQELLVSDTTMQIKNLNDELDDLKNQTIASHDVMKEKQAEYLELAKEKDELESSLSAEKNKTFFQKLFGK